MKRMMFMMMMAATVSAVEKNELMPLIETAATVTSNAYVEVRDKIVAHGKGVLPLLAEIAVDESLPWQQQLVARICYERIERIEDIEKLLVTDWYQHLEFNPEWNRYRQGPEGAMMKLVVDYMKKVGLWYYCLEVVWKTTNDNGKIFRRNTPENWAGGCTRAVRDNPEERVWFLRICSDVLKNAPDLDPYRSRAGWLYSTLRREEKPDTVPILLEAMHNQKGDIFGFVVEVSKYADARSIEAIEQYIAKYPPPPVDPLWIEAIQKDDPTVTAETFHPRRFAQALAPVRARPAPPPTPEPPFRLGTKVIKEKEGVFR